jgi:nicotinate-nucleotide adenylyltransferase
LAGGGFLRFGILGGTFDPIHLGHCRLAEETGEDLQLEKVFLIPAAAPPHKERQPITSFQHRLEMTRIAVQGSSVLEALDLEGRRQGLSYSIETLRELHEGFKPDPEIFFILGMDAFLEIDTWKEYTKLFDYAHFVVIDRPGFGLEGLKSFLLSLGVGFRQEREAGPFVAPSGYTVTGRKATLMDISSTMIREKAFAGQSFRFLVPEAVRSYITENGLYGVHGGAR